jgi:hypothetical protein
MSSAEAKWSAVHWCQAGQKPRLLVVPSRLDGAARSSASCSLPAGHELNAESVSRV